MTHHRVEQVKNVIIGLAILLFLAYLLGDPAAVMSMTITQAKAALGLTPQDAPVVMGDA